MITEFLFTNFLSKFQFCNQHTCLCCLGLSLIIKTKSLINLYLFLKSCKQDENSRSVASSPHKKLSMELSPVQSYGLTSIDKFITSIEYSNSILASIKMLIRWPLQISLCTLSV